MRNTPNRHFGITNDIPERSTTSRDTDYLDSLLTRLGVRRPECSADAMAANASVKERSTIALDILTLHIYTYLTRCWPLSCVACFMVPRYRHERQHRCYGRRICTSRQELSWWVSLDSPLCCVSQPHFVCMSMCLVCARNS